MTTIVTQHWPPRNRKQRPEVPAVIISDSVPQRQLSLMGRQLKQDKHCTTAAAVSGYTLTFGCGSGQVQ